MTETETGAATTGHGYAYCCEVCDGTDPQWHIMRRGDVAVSWACDDHLAAVCGRLQRDFEVTTLLVSDSRKARGRAETARPDVMLYGWGTDPDIWSGGALDDLADYQAWLTEHAIWEAMMARQDGNLPGQDDTPA